MKILVTGAGGFLGKYLCTELESRGHKLVRLDSKNCDLTKSDSLMKFNGNYDQIFHLAAWTQAGDFALHHPGEQWIINQKINTNILSWWQEYQPQAKLIAIGTSCAYDPKMPHKEENYMAGTPIESLFTYAMTKRMLYAGLVALNKQFGLRYLYLVSDTLYGPDYHADSRQMHFIFDIIRKILRGKLYGEPVVLWGDGNQKREVVYVHDFVRLALQLNEMRENDIINVAPGEEFSIKHYAKLVCEKVGYDFEKIQFDTTKYVGAESKCLVIDKLKGILPNPEFTPLDIGLSKAIDWFWSKKEKLLG